jgi:indolepyruvate ferredoxin oxidoreductase beta subunit
VGGQDVVTIARLLGAAALESGLAVVQGELHGMSQRGGAVHAHLRLSDAPIESPQVARGGVDLLLGLEPVEALRELAWLAPQGRLCTALRPVENILDYPPMEAVRKALDAVPGAILLDAHEMAREAGSARAENFVMAGAAAALLPVPPECVRAVVERHTAKWPKRDREAALEALDLGIAAARAAAVGALCGS